MTDYMAEALGPVIDTLESLEIPYFIGGSVASSVHGTSRSTVDVDIVADLKSQHVSPLAERLSDYYVSIPMIHDALHRRSCFNIIHMPTAYKIDFFVLKQRAFDQLSMQRVCRHFVAEGLGDPFVASAEDVILNKLEWYERGDRTAKRQLEDVIEVIRLQLEVLDYDHLRSWAEQLGVANLLAEVVAEAKRVENDELGSG